MPTNPKQQLCIKPTGFLVVYLNDKNWLLVPVKPMAIPILLKLVQ